MTIKAERLRKGKTKQKERRLGERKRKLRKFENNEAGNVFCQSLPLPTGSRYLVH